MGTGPVRIPSSPTPEPSSGNWWRIIAPGTPTKVFSPASKAIIPATVGAHTWKDGIIYTLQTKDGDIEASEDQLTPTERPDWLLCQPSTDKLTELFLEYDDK